MLYQLSYASLNLPETGLTPEFSGRNCPRRVHGTELKISTGSAGGQTRMEAYRQPKARLRFGSVRSRLQGVNLQDSQK